MKILFVGVNASYSHTCLAVREICEFVKRELGEKTNECGSQQESVLETVEFTINQPVGEILRGIYERQPDMVLFSTYIWNAEITAKIIPDIKKLLPAVVIGAGGPEFGFAAELYLKKLPELDFVIKGEGEQTTTEIIGAMMECEDKRTTDGEESVLMKSLIKDFQKIKDLYFRTSGDNDDESVIFTGERELICDLSDLPFPYPELQEHPADSGSSSINKNKIYYYESSRGCPYSCAYCMSSLDKRVRFKPLEQVFAELQIFLDRDIPLVKFVDRTYNLQPERYIAIWCYILQHHNKLTMFHFEIEAEFLTDEALDFLQSVPAGVMQFEIGVQSANKKSLDAVNRSTNIEKLAANVRRIPRTIHQHLDLIAGLPYENLESFGKSFDFVMSLTPDAIQLGFLKVLHGTQMERYAQENGWQWMENPVYETFSTPYLPYKDVLFLKDLEVLTDAFWNSGLFFHTMRYIGRGMGFWKFFKMMTELGQKQGVFDAARRETFWFEWLAGEIELLCDGEKSVEQKVDGAEGLCGSLNSVVLYDLLRYDFLLRGKQGNWPAWYKHIYNKDRHRQFLEESGSLKNPRLDFGHSEYEVFSCDVDSLEPEKTIVAKTDSESDNFTKQYEKLVRYPLH